MKICYLADINSAHTHKFLEYFMKKGHDIHVISLGNGKYEGVTVHELNVDDSVMKNSSEGGKLGYLKKIKQIKQLVNEIKPDILHAHYASSYGLLGALTKFHPYIISVWGSDVYDFPVKSPIHKMIIKYNLKKADCILSTSNVMKAETEKYTNKEIIVTPFGVDIEKFFVNKVEHDEIIIGTIKTLEEKYGVQYLVKAFAKVKEENKDKKLELRIGGRGSQREYLEKLCDELGIKNYVKFLGFLSPDQVITEFQKFDISVFPSTLDSESFGVAAVESEACGTPVIVSNVGGLMESTKPGVTSLVAEKMNVDDLAEKINKLVQNKELREKMGEDSRKFVEENYSLEKNFEDIEKIYFRYSKKQ